MRKSRDDRDRNWRGDRLSSDACELTSLAGIGSKFKRSRSATSRVEAVSAPNPWAPAFAGATMERRPPHLSSPTLFGDPKSAGAGESRPPRKAGYFSIGAPTRLPYSVHEPS